MPSKNAQRVVCGSCGWRGRRVYRDCECDCEGGCCICGPLVAFGACRRCGARRSLDTPADLREYRAHQVEMAALLKASEAAEMVPALTQPTKPGSPS